MSATRMTAKQMADALNRKGGWRKSTKATGSGYMALCPNHDDKNPSLSVREAQNGRIFLHCFAPTCTHKPTLYNSVERALGLDEGALKGPSQDYAQSIPKVEFKKSRATFDPIVPVPDDAPKFSIRDRRFKSKDFGLPVKAWVYRNAEGRPMGYIARYEQRDAEGKIVDKMIWPWTFALRDGRREWVVGAMPEPRVPYNLDKIVEHPEAVIQWHEGEKAAEAGERLFPDWITTTTASGGNAAFMTSFDAFAGRTVVICQDIDGPGVEYLIYVATELKKIGAKVRVLRFPTSYSVKDGELIEESYIPAEGDDMADHEDNGWTTDLIREAVSKSGIPLTWSIDEWENASESD